MRHQNGGAQKTVRLRLYFLRLRLYRFLHLRVVLQNTKWAITFDFDGDRIIPDVQDCRARRAAQHGTSGKIHCRSGFRDRGQIRLLVVTTVGSILAVTFDFDGDRIYPEVYDYRARRDLQHGTSG